jgi:uncharacterized membrane protein YeaQ/YmgE (transglycosylase-associated protein family)
MARPWNTLRVIGYLLALVLTGLIVGALGRLAVPGPNPMSIGATILVGLGGALLGGLVGLLLFGRNGGGIILAVLGAALIVWLLERHGPNQRRT